MSLWRKSISDLFVHVFVFRVTPFWKQEKAFQISLKPMAITEVEVVQWFSVVKTVYMPIKYYQVIYECVITDSSTYYILQWT